MVIDKETVANILENNNIEVTGVLHIGSHECQEFHYYKNRLNISPENMIWIDANPSIVKYNKAMGIPNAYHAVITDKDDDTITFNISSNNGESSSIFELKHHAVAYPYINYVDKIEQKTVTIDSFFQRNNLDPSKYVFWNFDIQGAELLALYGGKNSIKNAKAIYLEVNVEELYKGCGRINEIESFLSNEGFERANLTMTEYGWGDAIYIRKTS
jgi:FkbM family methyltransferase